MRFKNLLRNGDIDDERAESIQSAVVKAGRTADTIQAVHDVVEERANFLLISSGNLDETDISKKIHDALEKLRGYFFANFIFHTCDPSVALKLF